MKRAIIVARERVELQDFAVPDMRDDQVLVRVKACGLCTFEQRYFTGGKEDYPFGGGHEVCGIVEAAGPAVQSGVKPGDKVVVAAITRCGQCYYCQRGMNNLCLNGGDAPASAGQPWGPGGLSEYMVCQGHQVYKIANHVDFAVGTLAEPLACVLRSMQKGNLVCGGTAVVTGAGIMGLLHLLLAKQNGQQVIITEVDADRKAMAEKLGADLVVDPTRQDLQAAVREKTDGIGAETVFYTAGGAGAVKQGIGALAKGGTIVLYGAIYPKGTMEIDPNLIHYDEINITGLVSTTKESFRQAARMLSQNQLDLSPFISETVPLEKIDYAFRRAVAPDTYRVVVTL